MALVDGREATHGADEKYYAAHPGKTFRDCAINCPEMVVVRDGNFAMGSPENEKDRDNDESPQHEVKITERFAAGKYAVTFAEWEACVAGGGCGGYSPEDVGWGRGNRPVINVGWDDSQEYVKWLSHVTGKNYRLLTEAEWEYAARAGTTTAYYWGDEIGEGKAVCQGCGSPWDNKQTAPVGQFQPNAFGLYDMAGNVFQWVEDCKATYGRTPSDGSAYRIRNCGEHVLRGASWSFPPHGLRSAFRKHSSVPANRIDSIGFRVARTLSP
jgi:formylglycine-generating enzyme required for sulfatase activity